MASTAAYGHYTALLTVIIWGTTFVSTKVLLGSFLPIEILFFRFLAGFIALLLIKRGKLRSRDWKEEGLYAAAGLTGICLYYLLENIALTYTMASNTGIIVSTAPFFTALFSRFASEREERLSPMFLAGFASAMAGIIIVSISGSSFEINPRGDLLALAAAAVWGIYANITKSISRLGHDAVLTTRRSFLYGLLFMIPVLMLSDASAGLHRFREAENLLNMLYLGLGASALCFVTWNYSVSKLGAVKTSTYIYLTPVITIIFSAIFLSEPVTPMMIIGTLLTILGLVLSQKRSRR